MFLSHFHVNNKISDNTQPLKNASQVDPQTSYTLIYLKFTIKRKKQEIQSEEGCGRKETRSATEKLLGRHCCKADF